MKKNLPNLICTVYFGLPGSGKTTFAAWLVKHDLKKKRSVWSNVPITGAYKVDCEKDLGKYSITEGRLIIDEASVEFNNRLYKQFSKDQIKFFKYHRHNELAIDVFSQSHDDMDITLRRLAQKYYIIKKSLIPYFVFRKRIRKKIGIDKETHQIIDQYYEIPIFRRYIFSPLVWRYFNTLSRDDLPKKEWEKW